MKPLFWTLARIKIGCAPEAFAVLREVSSPQRKNTGYRLGRTLTGFEARVRLTDCLGRFRDKDRAVRAERVARLAYAEHSQSIRVAETNRRQQLAERDQAIRSSITRLEGA